ncbi:nuclear inhibitor of protein phosphatase 1-like [Mytilus galloprovincialis]|uniref:nuclear inhibitor of protein phosphatase 1-like n=1 Tax=Mytilus galloprovincialis TaxID=29158 RepID=UPI003F7B7E02
MAKNQHIQQNDGPLVNNFEVPSWAGKPPPGLHLDVVKENKMVQKLMIDTKKCYFFGRNKQMCDFCIDHQSCSRVHAALVWHKHLSRPFILDLGSTHGTFIGRIRLESKKPQQVPIDSEIHFGASTRLYIIRERPQPISGQMNDDKDKRGEDLEGSLLGLPETETELDNLTEFNTAHNRRIASMKEDGPAPNPLKRKHKNAHVFFYDEEDIINPEDIDPSVGRFRNLVSTTVIPTKRQKLDGNLLSSSGSMTDNITKRLQSFSYSNPNLYGDLPSSDTTASIASKMGIHLPNLAPDIEEEPTTLPVIDANQQVVFQVEEGSKEPRKKKYAKEAWPGKKPTHSFLV